MNNNLIEWKNFNSIFLDKDRLTEKPIFIFIYSEDSKLSLKMENEIFNSKDISNIINREFIPIKIDRYRETNLFKYYKNVYKLINRKETNEPICIFATSTLEPFYAFGYMQKNTKDKVLGFRELLDIVLEKCKIERDTLIKNGKEILSHLNREEKQIKATKLNLEILKKILKSHIDTLFNKEYGGFGDEIKFLNSSVLDLMLCMDSDTVEKALFTLNSMRNGTIYDNDRKRFYRYSLFNWELATKESLNYQNGLIAKVYIKAFELTKDKIYSDIALELLEKIEFRHITSLDSIIIDAMFYSFKIDKRYQNRALKAIDNLLEKRYINRELYHTDNIKGFLEDYAYFSYLLLNAYKFSDNEDYLIFSQNILNIAIEKFYKGGKWLFSNDMVNVYEDIHDIDYPSSIAIILEVMENIMKFVEEDYNSIIYRTLEVNSYNLMRQPLSTPNMTKVLIKHLDKESSC